MRQALAALVLMLALVPTAAAQMESTCDPVDCDDAPIDQTPSLAVVFVGGYGTNLDSARALFAPMRSALAARNANILFLQYSYTGTSMDGCTALPSPYGPSDTAQDFDTSERALRQTLAALQSACPVPRVVVVGHSLGGLIAFHALDTQANQAVTDLVTIDSPLGGMPLPVVRGCVDSGLCPDGPIVSFLANLYAGWSTIGGANSARSAAFDAAGVRVTAWGSQSDCFYDVALCGSLARRIMGPYDARASQWIGIPRAMQRDFPVPAYPWNITVSHTAVLTRAAGDIAADVLP